MVSPWRMVLRVAGLSGAGSHETHYSNEELKMILRTNTSTTGEKGDKERFTHDERHILAQSLEFVQHTVSDLMRPINEVSALYASRSFEQNMIAELRSLTNRDALLRLRDGSLLRASRTYMPALADAISHLDTKAA